MLSHPGRLIFMLTAVRTSNLYGGTWKVSYFWLCSSCFIHPEWLILCHDTRLTLSSAGCPAMCSALVTQGTTVCPDTSCHSGLSSIVQKTWFLNLTQGLLIHISEVPISNLNCDTSHPSWGFLWFFSSPPG
jgi:hypothetical protein